MEILVAILLGILVLAMIAGIACLPALAVMYVVNEICAKAGSTFHLSFWFTWLALFALGVVGRVAFGVRRGK